MARIVIALGGNALGNNPEEQKQLVQLPAQKIVSLIKLGHEVVIGHGNGPQVGMIYNAFADAKKVNPKTPLVPFAEAGGMSQGYIGYHMVTAIANELKKAKIAKDVIYVLTETIVDHQDPAFQKPSKPVGPFYATLAEAEANNPHSTIIEDAGRGYRKVVPSPKPVDFLGIQSIKAAIKNGTITIVGGGGGIPLIVNQEQYLGVDGVIDKDFALAKIAQMIDADIFIILTAVEHVYVNWGQANQKALIETTSTELEQYVQENQFAPGSMLPKVQAAISFVQSGPNKSAIIADLAKVELALSGKSGTKIVQ